MPKDRTAQTQLTPEQEQMRQLLVETAGKVTTRQLMERFAISRSLVWEWRAVIRQLAPPPSAWDELAELERSMAWFDQHEARLCDELDENDQRLQGTHGQAGVGFLQVRCQLMAQLQQLESDRRAFLQSVGYLRELPKRVDMNLPGLAGGSLDAYVDKLLAEASASHAARARAGNGGNGGNGSKGGNGSGPRGNGGR